MALVAAIDEGLFGCDASQVDRLLNGRFERVSVIRIASQRLHAHHKVIAVSRDDADFDAKFIVLCALPLAMHSTSGACTL